MAKLLMPREQVKKMLAERIQAGEDVDAKAEIAEQTGDTATGSSSSPNGAAIQSRLSRMLMKGERSPGNSSL
jgi:hypothetical protein